MDAAAMQDSDQAQTRAAQPGRGRLLDRLRNSLKATPASRILRRRAFTTRIWRNLLYLKIALLTAGYLWMILIPLPELGRRTYIDENALGPGQVNTGWSWSDVQTADRYLALLENLVATNASSEQRAQAISAEFDKLGLLASTQAYSFSANTGHSSGVNSYAVLKAPRASGTEAMLISASWISRSSEDGSTTLNLRGISTVLALASFLKKYSLWAKDIVFVVSDEYLDGMHAFVSMYHGHVQDNMQAEHLTYPSGVIWTALNIDYPGHSFSHLGIFFEGINGRLPNQDLINSFQLISRYTGGVSVLAYDHLDAREHPHVRDELGWIPHWIPALIRDREGVKTYEYQARNVFRHFGYQSRGRASGVHGLLHKYRIDAITIFAVPATGPHGFHAIGRVIESTLRTTNNLLERLHASFFFYILTSPERFIKIGNYLPSAVVVSVGIMFTGLGKWVDAGWILEQSEKSGGRWRRRDRPTIEVLGIMAITHLVGVGLLALISSSFFVHNMQIFLPLTFLILSSLPPLIFRRSTSQAQAQARPQLAKVLQAMNLCFASTVISITTVLNFSLAALLAILLGIPLSLSSSLASSPSSSVSSSPTPGPGFRLRKYAMYAAYTCLGLGWMIFVPQEEIVRVLREWEVFGVWFAPLVCVVYAPLVVQAGIVCLLS